MHTRRTLAALALGLAVVQGAHAAPDPVDILIRRLTEKGVITQEDAAGIRAEIASIAKEQAAPAKPAPAVSVKNPVRLSGYVQTRFVGSSQDGLNDSLEARRVRLTIAGDPTPTTDLRFQVDFAGSRRAQTSASQSNVFSRPTLVDGALGVKLPRSARLQVGQFKIPFGSESLASGNAFELVNRSAVTEALVPGRDIGSQGRDIGIQVGGSWPAGSNGSQVDLALGVFNGGGINVGDDNDGKDIAARVNWRALAPGLSLAAQLYDGRRGAGSLTHDRQGLEALYSRNPWFVRAEHIWAKDDDVKKRGYYATLGYTVTPLTQALVRYDRLDPNTAVGDDATGTLTLGLNRFLSRDGLQRWQVNYERRREGGVQVDNDQFLAQFQLGF